MSKRELKRLLVFSLYFQKLFSYQTTLWGMRSHEGVYYVRSELITLKAGQLKMC